MNAFLLIEIIGTIAFASSGAMVAIRKHLDLLGVIVLGVTTAVGGGMMRDLLIGIHPPTLFTNPVYVLTAAIAVLILFFSIKYLKLPIEVLETEKYDQAMSFLDAVGLGAFTVVGIDTAIANGLGQYRFLIIFLGVITGVGGGVLRDVMAGEIPGILQKHVYACASIAGAVSYLFLLRFLSDGLALTISTVLVVVIRMLARKYQWNLPRAW